MKRLVQLLTMVMILSGTVLIGQEEEVSTSDTTNKNYFESGLRGLSRKKVAYVHLKNGQNYEAFIKKVKRDKGLIEEITVIDLNEKKHKLSPEDISQLYVAPDNVSRYASGSEHVTNARRWGREDLNSDILSKGYILLEGVDVQVKKKKTEPLLLQLVNPNFSGKVSVYHTPKGGNTNKIGSTFTSVGGVNLAGGLEKYYIIRPKGVKNAYYIKNKQYDEQYPILFKGCAEMLKKKNPKWKEFSEDIYAYTFECE